VDKTTRVNTRDLRESECWYHNTILTFFSLQDLRNRSRSQSYFLAASVPSELLSLQPASQLSRNLVTQHDGELCSEL
jgi:hypothetical protein